MRCMCRPSASRHFECIVGADQTYQRRRYLNVKYYHDTTTIDSK